MKQIAEDKATDSFFDFMKIHQQVNVLRKKIAYYTGKCIKNLKHGIVKAIQAQWRCRMRQDQTRKYFIIKLWNEAQEKLALQYQSKGRKHQTMARKITEIPQVVRDKLLNAFYTDCKIKHIIALRAWVKNRKNLDSVFSSSVPLLEAEANGGYV